MSLKPGMSENEELLEKALQSGLNFFDTADLYDKGLNEELIGKTFGKQRKEVIIATKVGNHWRTDGSGWDWNPRKEYILESIEGSLKRLQTDYIDLYQLHGGTIQDNIDETIEAFDLLLQQGKIRYYGISSIRPNVIREWVNRSRIVSVMTQYSLLDRRPEETTLSLLQRSNIGVLARGSVAQGLLINKPPKDYLKYSKEEVGKAASVIRSLFDNGRTASQTALNFVLHHPSITSAIVGIRTIQQLEESLRTTDVKALSGDEMQLLRESIPVNYYEEHR